MFEGEGTNYRAQGDPKSQLIESHIFLSLFEFYNRIEGVKSS
jgi:hypothetical protein